MAEPISTNRMAAARRLIGCGVVLLALFSSASASAAPDTHAVMPSAKQAPVVPPSFQLQGTNGYSIVVIANQPRGGIPGSVQIVARKGEMGVSYSAPAAVTETSIAADLGALGQISVNFRPNGQLNTRFFKCAGREVPVVAGNYEGTIAFHGEGGYTEAEATSVPGNIGPLLAMLCGFITASGGSPNTLGAELYVRNPGLGPRFSVFKSSPASAARFFVEDSEYNSGISIQRFARFSMPSGSFRYGRTLQTATVHPPTPFSGTARFDRRQRGNRRWSGDLTINMPGMTGAPLTGRFLRAGLVHPESTLAGR